MYMGKNNTLKSYFIDEDHLIFLSVIESKKGYQF